MTSPSMMSGYYAGSIWPVECGNPQRSKVTERRLDLRPGERLAATARDTGRWNVMFVWRDAGELYLFGTTQLGDRTHIRGSNASIR